MIIFGWILVTLGVLGTASAVGLELKFKHPIWMLVMKITSGIMGCGGLILAIQALT